MQGLQETTCLTYGNSEDQPPQSSSAYDFAKKIFSEIVQNGVLGDTAKWFW